MVSPFEIHSKPYIYEISTISTCTNILLSFWYKKIIVYQILFLKKLRNVNKISHCSHNVKLIILFIKLKNFGQRAMQWKGVLYIHVIICQCRYALIIYGNTKCRPIYIICCWCGGGFCVIWSSSIRFFMQNALLSFFRRPLFFALGFLFQTKIALDQFSFVCTIT